MKDLFPLALDPYDNDSDNKFLLDHDAYIRTVARKAIIPGIFSEDVLPLEIDELIQIIRVKLWKSYQKNTIANPRAYIRTIAHTTAIDMLRSHRPTVSLSTDENGELSVGDLIVTQNKELQDPACEIELKELAPGLLAKLVAAIISLPPRQKQAVVYSLKDHQDDILPLTNALKAYGIDIAALEQPDEENEIYLLRASLSVARKKLQWLRKECIDI